LFDQFGGHAVILLPQTPVRELLVLVFHDYRFFFFFFLFVWSVNNATEKSRQIMKKQTKTLRSENWQKREKQKNSNFVSAQQQHHHYHHHNNQKRASLLSAFVSLNN